MQHSKCKTRLDGLPVAGGSRHAIQQHADGAGEPGRGRVDRRRARRVRARAEGPRQAVRGAVVAESLEGGRQADGDVVACSSLRLTSNALLKYPGRLAFHLRAQCDGVVGHLGTHDTAVALIHRPQRHLHVVEPGEPGSVNRTGARS